MRKYNRRILTALVIAYKKGLINKKPLNRWLSNHEIFYRILNYSIFLILFGFIFIIFNQKSTETLHLNELVKISNILVSKAKIVSGISIGLMSIVLLKLVRYIYHVLIVKKAYKKYNFNDGNVEMLNKVTYKIQV